MRSRKPLDIIYPTILNVEHFHKIIVSQRGSIGYNSIGLIDVGIEWAKHTITYHESSPGLLTRAGALMFAYTNFHAWADGNKRTALMTTAFFLRSEEHTSELQSQSNLVCRLLLEKKKNNPD